MPVSRSSVTAVLVMTLTLGATQSARADSFEPFVQVEVNGETHRVVAFHDTLFCSRAYCVAGLIELQLDAGSVRVLGILHQGVDPRAPEYAYNHGQWSVQLYVDATNLSPDPMTIVAWAGTPISPLFLFPNCCEMFPTHGATYSGSLLRTLIPGEPDPDTVSVEPVFPDLDGDGDAEIFNALATSTPGGVFQSLGVDRGTAVTGKGIAHVFGTVPAVPVLIDPDWVFLSAAVAFTLSGDGDQVNMRGSVLIRPARVPEPATLGLIGLGLIGTALRRRHRARRPRPESIGLS